MLTATFELGQEDVNPDVVVASSQSKSPSSGIRQSLAPLASINGSSNHREGSRYDTSARAVQQPQQYPLIKLKRRYREKENDQQGEEQQSPRKEEEQDEPEPVRRSGTALLQRKVEEDIRAILQRTREGDEGERKQTRRKRARLSLAAKALGERSPTELLVERQKRRVEEERRQRVLQKQRDWDRVEVCSEEAAEPTPEPEPEPQPLRVAVHKKVIIPRTYSKSSNSSSRLSLSKEFQRRCLLEEQRQLNRKEGEERKRRYQLDGSSSSESQFEEEQQQQQPAGAKCAKLGVAPGGDPMSIHHQQQQHHHHFHLPSTSSVGNSAAAATAVSTSSLLLLTSAAATGGNDSDSDGGVGMSGHSHYTRSKTSRIQGQMSLESATDMAIAASLNDLPRSKVASLQGRVDTGTATELAIAQSLNENAQNALNSAASATASSIPETPASIAAAANLNNALATLCNIGNSCYLNSVLYTLRFAPNFIHNLHHLIEDTDSVYQRLSQNKLKSSSLGRNIPGLHGSSGRSWSSKDLASLGGSTSNNSSSSTLGGSSTTAASNGTTNLPASSALVRDSDVNLPPKSNRQVVTEQLHELFQNLHRNEAIETAEPYHAGNILRAVQDVSATFEGNQQQDAHEFLMCVLDSIRESCQALIKTITDHPDVLMNTCPPVPECIETFVPETKSSGARVFFRRRKDPAKAAASKQQSPVNGGATTLPKVSGGGGDSASDQLASLKNALLAKTALVDDAIVRDRVQALGLDFFRDDFEGVTVAKTKCLECETCTEQKETMIDIAIPIASASEVSDAAKNPQQFYQNSCITREYFRGDNKYRCEVCCGYREAIRSISFEVLPRQLILQLKRFNGDMEKINSYIPTPFVLRCFCNTCLPKPDCDKPHIYRLYSVITHVGARMSVGHYIAYTSSLDVHGEYLGCGKDRRKQLLLAGGSMDGGGVGSGSFGSATNTGQSQKSSEKSAATVQLKKLFGGKKASSAGDMSKKLKNNNSSNNKLNLVNGMEGLNLINGAAGGALGNSNMASFGSQSGGNSPSSNGTPTGSLLASRIPCAGLNCCGIHLKNSHLSLHGHGGGHHHHYHHHHHHHHTSTDSPADGQSNGVDYGDRGMNGSTSTTTPAAFEQSLSQQLWHMCDDDKIKIMSQVEFEELLSPNRRHVITPYLLFYARYDLVPSAAAVAAAAAARKEEPAAAKALAAVSSGATSATAADADMTTVD